MKIVQGMPDPGFAELNSGYACFKKNIAGSPVQHRVNYFLELIHKITNLALDKFHFDLDNLKNEVYCPFIPRYCC